MTVGFWFKIGMRSLQLFDLIFLLLFTLPWDREWKCETWQWWSLSPQCLHKYQLSMQHRYFTTTACNWESQAPHIGTTLINLVAHREVFGFFVCLFVLFWESSALYDVIIDLGKKTKQNKIKLPYEESFSSPWKPRILSTGIQQYMLWAGGHL